MTSTDLRDPREDRLPVWARERMALLRQRLAEAEAGRAAAQLARGEQHEQYGRLRLTDPYRTVMYGGAAGGGHAIDVAQLNPSSVPSHLRGLPTLRVSTAIGYLQITGQAGNAVLLTPERGR